MDLNSANFSEEELYKLNIHDLRDIARQIGVSRPTTRKKDELVKMTLQIVFGEMPATIQKSGAGRPVRQKQKPSKLLYFLENQNQIHLNHGDNEFTANFVCNPEDIFVGDQTKSVASSKVEYRTDESNQDHESQVIFVSGVAVLHGDGIALETQTDGKAMYFEIDAHKVADYGIVAGDMIDGFVSLDFGIMTTVSAVNGEFVI